MTKQLYEDALADLKQIKEVAESNAKKAMFETLTPKIRELIETQILGDMYGDETEEPLAMAGETVSPDQMDDFGGASPKKLQTPATAANLGPIAPVAPGASMAGVSLPDNTGKVTLDLDQLNNSGVPAQPEAVIPDDDYELNLDSVDVLEPMVNASKANAIATLATKIDSIEESIKRFKKISKIVRETKSFQVQIAEMISNVDDMYEYVQTSVRDASQKSIFENKLEKFDVELNKLQEQQKKMNRKKNLMNEEDVTLKLTGLPDEIDLDTIGVDLITGEDEGADSDVEASGSDDLDLDVDAGDDVDMDDADEDMSAGDSDDELTVEEALSLSDDTIVEIDTKMLKRELARVGKRLREEALPSMKGGVDASALSNFGGGDDEGDPFADGEVTTEADESDDDVLDEVDSCDMDELQDRRKRDENGPEATDSHSVKVEARITAEKKLQERAAMIAARLKAEAKKARAQKNVKKFNELYERYKNALSRIEESKKRVSVLSESASKRGVKNNVSRLAENTAVKNLRNKLAESNLDNVKLSYANKLLQSGKLTRAQKAEAIQRLDEVSTSREAKLVYDSVVSQSKSVGSTNGAVVGSASKPTSSGGVSNNINEGVEASRWAKLAGLV